MADPQAIIAQARQGSAPLAWRVFTRKRGVVGAFFSGALRDPDPLLVITADGVVEYVSDKKPLAVVAFGDLSGIDLRANATTMSDSMHADLHVWLDLRYLNGKKVKWQPSSFRDNLQVIQCFIEAYSVHKALIR